MRFRSRNSGNEQHMNETQADYEVVTDLRNKVVKRMESLAGWFTEYGNGSVSKCAVTAIVLGIYYTNILNRMDSFSREQVVAKVREYTPIVEGVVNEPGSN